MGDVARVRAVYEHAATAFLDLVEGVPLERYAGPGLGDWDLRALVGHAGRSFETVSTYLGTRAETVVVADAAAYYVLIRRVGETAGAAVHERGVAAGRALGDDPLGTLRAHLAAALEALDGVGEDDPVVETIAGGMRVSDYLPTRTFELVVHSLDVARALDADFAPPPDALRATLEVAAGAAAELGHGAEVLLALTGRGPLPEGSSVVG